MVSPFAFLVFRRMCLAKSRKWDQICVFSLYNILYKVFCLCSTILLYNVLYTYSGWVARLLETALTPVDQDMSAVPTNPAPHCMCS